MKNHPDTTPASPSPPWPREPQKFVLPSQPEITQHAAMKIAIIGTGNMGRTHARNFSQIENVEVVACADIDQARADAFAQELGIPRAFTDVAELLALPGLDAVSIVTPDSSHCPLSLQAIAAGKHVLCEKPLATSYADAQKMAEAAQAAGVINMVNFSYRNSSAIQLATQWVADGKIGRIRHVEGRYLQSWLTGKDWGDWKTSPNWLWRLSKGHHSKGALGDVGVHIIDFATMPVGPISDLYASLPVLDKAPDGKLGDYTLDANDTAILTVRFANGAAGLITATRFATGHMNSVSVSIHGEKGAIRIDLDKSYQMLEWCEIMADGKTTPWQSVYTGKTPTIYERFAASVATGKQDMPDFARGAEIQRYLDAAEESADKGRAINLG